MAESISLTLKDWIPYKLSEENGNALCRWLYLGDAQFSDPFFDESYFKCMSLPNNSSVFRPVSGVEILPEWSAQIESIPPTAFIFHISRCGSTLIAQLLGMDPSRIVLSEVPFFDEVLLKGFKENVSVSQLLNAAIGFYGAKRNGQHSYLFIKTDSWHLHYYKQLRELYPRVPFLLLYRRPDEVIRSHQKRRGTQAVPGLIDPAIFNLSKEGLVNLNMDEYLARVLESYFTSFLEILKADKLAVPFNYNEGAINIVKKIAGLSGISLNAGDVEAMKVRASFHGKYPGQVFEEPALNVLIPAYQERVFELYNEVEIMRAVWGKLGQV